MVPLHSFADGCVNYSLGRWHLVILVATEDFCISSRTSSVGTSEVHAFRYTVLLPRHAGMFYFNSTQARVLWEEETSTEKIGPPDWP